MSRMKRDVDFTVLEVAAGIGGWATARLIARECRRQGVSVGGHDVASAIGYRLHSKFVAMRMEGMNVRLYRLREAPVDTLAGTTVVPTKRQKRGAP